MKSGDLMIQFYDWKDFPICKYVLNWSGIEIMTKFTISPAYRLSKIELYIKLRKYGENNIIIQFYLQSKSCFVRIIGPQLG